MRLLLVLLLLSPLGETNLDRFDRHVHHAAAMKGFRSVAVVPWTGHHPTLPLAMAWVTYTTKDQPVHVFIRTDVLDKGSPALIELLAYHEVCHPSLPVGHTEDDADQCARRMFFSKAEWRRAVLERSNWR